MCDDCMNYKKQGPVKFPIGGHKECFKNRCDDCKCRSCNDFQECDNKKCSYCKYHGYNYPMYQTTYTYTYPSQVYNPYVTYYKWGD